LEELILNKNVYLLCKDFDKYGRILGVVKYNLSDKKTINDIMLEEGHGDPYFG
jgi:endonuclease YncB( thermonuclease family)